MKAKTAQAHDSERLFIQERDSTSISASALGLSVTFMIGAGMKSAFGRRRAAFSITARMASASIRAKALPMQIRGPAPKGM